MQRRTLLRAGLALGAVLAAGGATLALVKPGRQGGHFTESGRAVWTAVARGVLADLLPADAAARERALGAHLQRLEASIAGMPPFLQAEVDELTTLLGSAAGRRALAGLSETWSEASLPALQAMLQGLRHSSVALRQQVFHALRDLTNAAWFADPATWTAIGYTGQRPVPGPEPRA